MTEKILRSIQSSNEVAGALMSARRSGRDGNRAAFENFRRILGRVKPILIKATLGAVAVLGVLAEIFEPVGDFLKRSSFLGGSFIALVALIIFDAISESSDAAGDDGVYLVSRVEDLRDHVELAFDSKEVRIDFSGFTMESLLLALRPALGRLGDSRSHNRSIRIRVALAHLDAPMNFPSGLRPARESPNGSPAGLQYFEDSPLVRERAREIRERSVAWMRNLIASAQQANPHLRVECEVRESPVGPAFKLCLINNEVAFFGLYGISDVEISEQFRMLDVSAFRDAPGGLSLVGWSRNSRSESVRKVFDHYSEWFENLWGMLDYVSPPSRNSE
ncbi:hypothetical protein ABT173_29655 [Streptomyces sp. NPDC001795]|uniref:hypothetical protein n=1 Tax=unclassified Streptomyces TaxID=2593676 RepID=UPI0033304382